MRIIVTGGTHQGSVAKHLVEAFESVTGDPVTLVDELRFGSAAYANMRWLGGADLLVWARARGGQHGVRRGMLTAAASAGVPTVGYHSDQFWGLERQAEIGVDPFFECDWMFTTDGGHDDEWEKAGVNHVWVPPATRKADTLLVGGFDRLAAGNAVFVGAWERYHHPEWPWRTQMIRALKSAYGQRFVCYPRSTRNSVGEPVTGQALADVYASASVVVGDSCLAGQVHNYWSDRVPITLGMGGMLVHPEIPGMEQSFVNGRHLLTFPAGDMDTLVDMVGMLLADGPVVQLQKAGRAEVAARHTFDNTAAAILTAVGIGVGESVEDSGSGA